MNDDLKERLRPCPFCGGPAFVFRKTQACCADERCAGWTVNRCSIEKWNTRAPNPRITDLEARLAAAEAGEDALAKALRITRERLMDAVHSEFDGVWSAEDFDEQEAEAVAALAAYEARRG